MDIVGNRTRKNTPVIMYPCHNGPNQQFRYNKKTNQIRGRFSKKCVDISKNRIVIQKCKSSKNTQKWKYKNKRLKTKLGCLDVERGDYHNGSLIVYPCHNGPNQQFLL